MRIFGTIQPFGQDLRGSEHAPCLEQSVTGEFNLCAVSGGFCFGAQDAGVHIWPCHPKTEVSLAGCRNGILDSVASMMITPQVGFNDDHTAGWTDHAARRSRQVQCKIVAKIKILGRLMMRSSRSCNNR